MEYTGGGDPERSMRLLWGAVEEPTRGPAQGLDVEEVVREAIALADEEGLGAVTMRGLARRLGRSPMSLYTYVPGKAELLDLMVDRLLQAEPTDHRLDDGWRPAMEQLCRDTWAFYERHPWVLQLGMSRAALGPGEFDAYEALMRILDGIGLTALEMQRTANAIASLVRGAARSVADARAAEQATGVSDDEWWNARSPWIERLAPDTWAERYPTLTRISQEGAFDQADADGESPYTVQEAITAFEHGLRLMLDGVEALIATRL